MTGVEIEIVGSLLALLSYPLLRRIGREPQPQGDTPDMSDLNVLVINALPDRGANLLAVPGSMRAVGDADVVLQNHQDGTFSMVKNRFGVEMHKVPWDQLPPDVKRAARP